MSRDQGQVADPWRVSLEYYAVQVFRSADAIFFVSLVSINDCFHSLVIDWICLEIMMMMFSTNKEEGAIEVYRDGDDHDVDYVC